MTSTGFLAHLLSVPDNHRRSDARFVEASLYHPSDEEDWEIVNVPSAFCPKMKTRLTK